MQLDTTSAEGSFSHGEPPLTPQEHVIVSAVPLILSFVIIGLEFYSLKNVVSLLAEIPQKSDVFAHPTIAASPVVRCVELCAPVLNKNVESVPDL